MNGSYPLISDSKFYEKITKKKELYDNRITKDYPGFICYQPYQKFIANYMSVLTTYNSLLVNHQVGLGKTLSAIAVAEMLKDTHKPIILAKNDILINNFKSELLGKCSNYITPEERNIISDQSIEPEERTKVLKRITDSVNKVYTFYKYGDFKINQLSNRVLIIDEVHNITNNNLYMKILEVLKRSTNVKLILLSATPVFDNIIEAFHIINLLSVLDKIPLLPNTFSGLQKMKLIKKSPFLLKSKLSEQKTTYELTKLGLDTIKRYLKGKTSFLITDNSYFAHKIYIGSHLIPEDKKSIIIKKVKMSPLQEKMYKKNIPTPGTLYQTLSDISTIVYPGEISGSEGYNKNIIKDKNLKILTIENIKQYSPKLYKIVKNIQNAEGIVFIYSNFVTNGGTSLIKKTLEQNGYTRYGTRSNTPKYFSFEESTSIKRKVEILRILNSLNNKDGKIIKVIIGSPVVSEGVTFKNIRQIHILEPSWNLSRIDQIIGRGVRFKSHQDLPLEQRNVKIYMYASVFNEDTEMSIDLFKYRISQVKDFNIKKIEHIIKTTSVDCYLNKERNHLSTVNDFTRNCQYKECNYICPYESTTKIKTIKDSYNLSLHSKEEQEFIRRAIKELFKQTSVVDTKSLVDFVKKYEFDNYNTKTVYKNNIYNVIKEFVDTNEKVMNKKNKETTIIQAGKYFVANPKNNKFKESFYKKLFS